VDRAHEEFRDDASDFTQLQNLWKFFDEEFVHKKSNRKLFEVCREHFLSYVRMREWRDLAGQLREMASELRIRENEKPATYERIHRALLTGLVTNVGFKAQDGDHYQGPRGLQFAIWPGSGLKKNRPRWVVAGELQETTRIYARNVARIEPEWIERAAAHLVERAIVEPHWDKARGEVVAYENVSLYGLVLVARRKVSYGRIDPARARGIFIEGALVAGEFEFPIHSGRTTASSSARSRSSSTGPGAPTCWWTSARSTPSTTSASRRKCATRARSMRGTGRRRARMLRSCSFRRRTSCATARSPSPRSSSRASCKWATPYSRSRTGSNPGIPSTASP
jgi:HrpA-like RNA helicase